MELLTVPPPNNSHHFRSSEVTSPFGGDSHPVQGSSHQVPYIALEGGVLDQKDTDLIDLGPTFQEYISDVSASAPFRQPSCDENTNPYAGRGHISTDTLGLNEGLCVCLSKLRPLTNTLFFGTAIPHSAFGDSCRDLGYDADPYNGEGDHHYSCDCSSCGTVCYNVDLGKTRNFEALAAPASQYAGELVASQGFDPPSPETEPRSASGPPFPTVYLPMVQQLSNSTDILRLLKRCVGGRAVCLWMHEGGECGFSSQIDLVKRHIKRVHLRLR